MEILEFLPEKRLLDEVKSLVLTANVEILDGKSGTGSSMMETGETPGDPAANHRGNHGKSELSPP